MKVNIVGINFSEYNMLKKIEQYFTDNDIECRYIDYLKKGNIEENIAACDGIIYVEIEAICDTTPFFVIESGMDGRTVAALFRKFIPALEEKKTVIVSESTSAEDVPWKTEESSNVSNLNGINVDINGKIVYLSKDDFDKFTEVKKLIDDLGYRIVEAITDVK